MRDAKERRSPERERARADRIGQVLISWGKLTREQLRAALDLEKNDHGRLGEILLSKNLVSGEDLARALAEVMGFEYVSLSEGSVDPAAAGLVDEKVLRKHGALPLRVEGGRLVLATSEPTNVLALDDLKALAGYPIRPVMAAGESIRNLQDRVFGLGMTFTSSWRRTKASQSLEQRTPRTSPSGTRGLRRCGSPTPSSARPYPRELRTSTSSPGRGNSSCATEWMVSRSAR